MEKVAKKLPVSSIWTRQITQTLLLVMRFMLDATCSAIYPIFAWNVYQNQIFSFCYSSGTPCNDYNGYCDILNKCRDVDAEGPLSRLKNFLFNSQTFDNILDWMKQYWWACVLIGLGLVLLMAGKATLYLALQQIVLKRLD